MFQSLLYTFLGFTLCSLCSTCCNVDMSSFLQSFIIHLGGGELDFLFYQITIGFSAGRLTKGVDI